jgi:hypothetical protein
MSVSRGDARQLLIEQREAEARKREVLEQTSSRRLRLTVCGERRFGVVFRRPRSLTACLRRPSCSRPPRTPARGVSLRCSTRWPTRGAGLPQPRRARCG